MRWAVNFFLAGGFCLFAKVAVAQCPCDTDQPLFAEDPLVVADEGIVPFVTPDMVSINDAGRCFVDNLEGFFEEDPQATYFHAGDEYAQAQVYTRNDFSDSWLATLPELRDWALEICLPLRQIS